MRELSYLILFILCEFSLGIQDRNVLVNTNDGTIRGVKERNAIVFKGVPFAAPPIGQNRWRDPQPVKRWSGIREANKYSKACAQSYGGLPKMFDPAEGISEDCLYLNVFAPLKESPIPLPVMLFIMGGGFQFGDASCPIYRGQYLSNSTSNIVVVINYRLGPFGFLNLNNGNITGNYGLKDQIKAMRWVKSNIKAFGGDPGKITIFGESAGAMSIGIHLTSTHTQGLYQRAIMESNPFGIPYRTPSNAKKVADVFEVLLNCAFKGERCLRQKSTAELIAAGDKLPPIPGSLNWSGLGISLSWMPTVDGTIVAGQPLKLFSQGIFQKIPIMLGSNTDEGLMFVMMAQKKKMSNIMYDAVVAASFGVHAPKILSHYPAPLNPFFDCRDLLSALITDAVFACPNRLVASSIAKKTSVHLYQLTYAPKVQTVGPDYCTGKVCHGEELPFIFHTFPGFTAQELKIGELMIDYWGGFARSGSPNGKASLRWPSFTHTDMQSLNINYPPSIVSGLKKATCDFWDSIGYNV